MENNPVATLRGLRGLLKAADVVAKDPERGARAMVSGGFTREEHYAATLEDLRMMPYDVWRTHDPSDTLRFYGLRLSDAGLIKSTPAEIVSRGTDLRFLREVNQTLKEA
jgi:NitT/TauT family transport system substrate-binding protein